MFDVCNNHDDSVYDDENDEQTIYTSLSPTCVCTSDKVCMICMKFVNTVKNDKNTEKNDNMQTSSSFSTNSSVKNDMGVNEVMLSELENQLDSIENEDDENDDENDENDIVEEHEEYEEDEEDDEEEHDEEEDFEDNYELDSHETLPLPSIDGMTLLIAASDDEKTHTTTVLYDEKERNSINMQKELKIKLKQVYDVLKHERSVDSSVSEKRSSGGLDDDDEESSLDSLSSSSTDNVSFTLSTSTTQHVHISRSILSCRSSQFHVMLSSLMSERNKHDICLSDVRYEVLMTVFKFLYCGDIDFSSVKSNASSSSSSSSSLSTFDSTSSVDPLELLIFGDRFSVDSLSELLELGLAKQIDIDNVCEYIVFSESFSLRILQQRACMFALIRLETLKKEHREGWNKISQTSRDLIEKWDQKLLRSA
jgi:hypothetical protein